MDDDEADVERPDRSPDEVEEPPLQNLADRIRETESSTGPHGGLLDDADADVADLFREERSGQLPIEAVWKAIESEGNDTVTTESIEGEHVVPKQWYCERCEHFGDPPEVRCTHAGTTILEFVGTEDVKVRDCPVVAERKVLGQFSGYDTK